MYTYQADVWCDSCGEAICAELRAKGEAPTAHELRHNLYDSDDYPKGYFEENVTDSPDHCAAGAECLEALEVGGVGYGALLSDDLTDYGREYVRNAVLEPDASPLVHYWAETFDIIAPMPGPWNRYDIAEAYAALAHDYGLYGIMDRLQNGRCKLRGHHVGDIDTLEASALYVYVINRDRAARTGPYEKRMTE